MTDKPIKNWGYPEIAEWCVANKQVKWLKAEEAKKVKVKVYPKVESVSRNGKKSWQYDKTKPYMIEEKDISFIELKQNFLEKFGFKEPKKEKKPTFHDLIKALPDDDE